MEEDFEFGFNDDGQQSVERYEEMIRNQDQYFFDAQAFEYIIDNYIEKNDPVKALQVVEFALNQHPYAAVFLIKQAQLLLFNQVFGSGADCLLFQIVREKYHLCYSVYGRFYNDLLIIYVGLEPDNINKAQSIINDIITNLTKCDDHTKFMQAKVQLIEALNRNASKDNYNLNLVLNHCYFNKEYDINKLINEINNLDISFINNLAQDLEYININILK